MSVQAMMQSDINIYNNMNSDNRTKFLGVCTSGTTVDVTVVNDYWYTVTNDKGITGYSEKSSAFKILTDGKDITETKSGDLEYIDYLIYINTSVIQLLENANTNSSIIGSLTKGEEVKVTKKSGNWFYVQDKGWFDSSSIVNKYIVETNNISTVTTTDQVSDEKAQFNLSSNYDFFSTSSTATQQILHSKRGIFGMPYQYMDNCDPKLIIDNKPTAFGRKYAEKLVQNMPLLLITPGKPKFMKKFNSSDKKNVLSSLAQNDESTLNQLLNNSNGKFYSLEFAYDIYFDVVNPMLKNIARLMNLGDRTIDGTSLSNYNWSNFRDVPIQSFISSKESIAIYIDSETQIQESFTNSIGQSSLAGSMNNLSDMSREIQFLLGSTSGAQFEAFKKENYDTSKKSLDAFVDKFSSILPNGIADRLTEGALTVATGGKLIFPEIWNDSEFSKSYEVTVKLRTPDPTPFSIYMDLYVPLCHLLGLVAPVQLNGNGYTSPFLIRAYYKGMFDIDMGIITNMSINKGDKGSWTLNGLPTTIDVTFTIKELYNVFSLSQESQISNMLTNTAEMDYLANLCGINVNNVDIQRSIKYYYYNLKESTKNKVTFNSFLGTQAYVSNIMSNIFGK